MHYWKKFVFCAVLTAATLGLGTMAIADTVVLTYADGTAKPSKPGHCSGVDWLAGKEFRMCSADNTSLGGGAPTQKSAVNGGETHTFTDGVLTAVGGTGDNPGTDDGQYPGSAAPGAATNKVWTENAVFLLQNFGFIAPYQGSLAAAAYGVATYIGGIPVAGNDIPFVFAPVLEAQWGGTWFPLGRSFASGDALDTGLGVTFNADVSNVVVSSGTATFDFDMYANEVINYTGGADSEDPTSAGFGGWTAQWHLEGTGTYTDSTPPTVTSTNPANGATGVSSALANISVTFSEPMDVSSITAGVLTLSGGETVGAPTASNQNKTFTFPITSSPLTDNTAYTVTFNAGPTDVLGNPLTLPNPNPMTFTAGTVDNVPPTISTRSPSSAATGVAINTAVVVTFSEAMNASSVDSAFSLTGPGNVTVTGTLVASNGNTVFTFSPDSDLAYSTSYTATVSSAATDMASNAFAGSNWSFTTTVDPASIPPPVAVPSPVSNDISNKKNALGCSMNSSPITLSQGGEWWLIASFMAWLGIFRKRGQFNAE